VEGLISPWHIAILVVILLLAFGPKRLPELGSALGKTITGFKHGLAEAQDEIRSTNDQVSAPASIATSVMEPVATTASTTAVVEPSEHPISTPTLTMVDGGDGR
jgi:sec-independent protein translocase protein TatA